ncbi:MAG: alpha/beta hydrolase, partial [Spirochaetia bacterium]|nr:alpha/beta hydrolase [Spirochaetia bacterium]
ANIASRVFPVLAVPAGLDPHHLSHDERIVLGYKNDPKVFKSATARWFTETMREQELALSRAQFIKIPTILLQGTADTITSIDASRFFFSELASKKKTWIAYNGMYHEILNEIDREKVYRDILHWIKKIL